jgi:hypothetical protein
MTWSRGSSSAEGTDEISSTRGTPRAEASDSVVPNRGFRSPRSIRTTASRLRPAASASCSSDQPFASRCSRTRAAMVAPTLIGFPSQAKGVTSPCNQQSSSSSSRCSFFSRAAALQAPAPSPPAPGAVPGRGSVPLARRPLPAVRAAFSVKAAEPARPVPSTEGVKVRLALAAVSAVPAVGREEAGPEEAGLQEALRWSAGPTTAQAVASTTCASKETSRLLVAAAAERALRARRVSRVLGERAWPQPVVPRTAEAAASTTAVRPATLHLHVGGVEARARRVLRTSPVQEEPVLDVRATRIAQRRLTCASTTSVSLDSDVSTRCERSPPPFRIRIRTRCRRAHGISAAVHRTRLCASRSMEA